LVALPDPIFCFREILQQKPKNSNIPQSRGMPIAYMPLNKRHSKSINSKWDIRGTLQNKKWSGWLFFSQVVGVWLK
jgi:hypothetical protein